MHWGSSPTRAGRRWIAAGANPKEVSVRAGHTSVSFTLDRYGHVFPSHDAELRDRLDAMHAQGLQRTLSRRAIEPPGPEHRGQVDRDRVLLVPTGNAGC
jgi:hypothetical protein